MMEGSDILFPADIRSLTYPIVWSLISFPHLSLHSQTFFYTLFAIPATPAFKDTFFVCP
jgi:hypothetical protein